MEKFLNVFCVLFVILGLATPSLENLGLGLILCVTFFCCAFLVGWASHKLEEISRRRNRIHRKGSAGHVHL